MLYEQQDQVCGLPRGITMTQNTWGLFLITAAVPVVVMSCADHEQVAVVDVKAPLVLANSLVYLQPQAQRLVVVDAHDNKPQIRSVGLVGDEFATQVSADGTRVFVLDGSGNTLFAVDDGGEAVVSYPLGAPFSHMATSDDGAVAVAMFREGDAAGAVFQNANEIAIVDLKTPPGELNPARATIRSFGDAPDGIRISPAVTLGETQRRVALVQSVSHIAVVDLNYPLAKDVSVPLATVKSNTKIVADQIEFAVESSTEAGASQALWAFVRSRNAPDLYAMRIVDNPDATGDEATLSVTLNLYYSGDIPSDMHVLDAQGSPRVFLVNQGPQTVSFVDALTAEVVSLPLGTPISRALRTDADAEKDLMVVYDTSGASTVHVIDLSAVESSGKKAVASYKVASGVGQVIVLKGKTRAIVRYGNALSMLDLLTGDAVPFTGTGTIVGLAVSPNNQELFAATQVDGEGYLVRVDLTTLASTPIRLLDVPIAMSVMPGTGRVAVDLSQPGGLLTLWGTEPPTEKNAALLGGFLWTGLLDGEISQ